jgi:uncharacterized protein YuzE
VRRTEGKFCIVAPYSKQRGAEMTDNPVTDAWRAQVWDFLEVKHLAETGVEERNQQVHAMMTCYDKTSDCLHVQIRALRTTSTIQIAENIWASYGEDRKPTGYGIQNASTEGEFIGQLILGVGADRELTLEDLANIVRHRARDWKNRDR